MADQYTLTCPSHAILVVVLLQSPQPVLDGWIFLGLRLFGAECVVAKREESNGGLLSLIEWKCFLDWY